MWFLKGPKGELIYLKRNSTITVGRIQGDIVLRDDKSISRSHASVFVQSKSEDKKSSCFVKDLGSKYGSSIIRGSETIKIAKEGTKVQLNDKIKFGLQNNDYIVFYIHTVVLVSSMNDINYLQSIMDDLDGYIVQEWTNQVSHLTTSKAKLGEKIAMALVNCIPIVGIEYWEAVQLAVKNSQDLPKFTEYILPITEDIIDNTKVSLSPNIDRKTVFNNLTFLFFSFSQFNIYKKIIKDAGGKALMFKRSIHTDLTQFCSDEFIVVYYMIGSSQTEESILDSQTTKSAYEEIEDLLRQSKRRMISDSEIMLAILHCSLQQNCNAKHNYKKLLLDKKQNVSSDKKKTNVFALDTEDLHSKSSSSHNENIIAETDEFTSQDFVDTNWSNIDNKNVPTPSHGLSAISAIQCDSQESTDGIENNLSKLSMDQRRSEKRSSDLVSSTPAKKAKFNTNSLFPVISKKNSQSLLNSQDTLCSQNLISSQLTSKGEDSVLLIDHIQQSTSQLQNKFNQPSTSKSTEKQAKTKSTRNIFGSWLEDSNASKINVIEELNCSKKTTETNIQMDKNECFEKKSKEKKIAQNVQIRSDEYNSALDNKNKKIELKKQRDSDGKVNKSCTDEIINCDEPKAKKGRINTSNNSKSFDVAVERSDKRKRDNDDSDSNNFVMQKKNRVNKKTSQIELTDQETNIDEDCIIVKGLIRPELHDASLNKTFGHKIFHKTYITIPRTRILRELMVAVE